jgi:hypothetical protein
MLALLDLDAYWCYLIVAAIGLVSAVVQIRRLLLGYSARWLAPGTWCLFFSYWLLPIGLFALLAQTHAIQDTSLFAALIVAVSYDRILAGNVSDFRLPQQVTSWWPSFLAWANKIAEKIAEIDALYERRFVERMIGKIVKDHAKFDALLKIVMTRFDNLAEVRQTLANVDTEAQQNNVADADVILERKVRALFSRHVFGLTDFQYTLFKQSVITRHDYYWYVEQGRSIVVCSVVNAILVVVFAVGTALFFGTSLFDSYYVARIGTPETSKLDQHRARKYLAARLVESDANDVARKLAALLKRPDLPEGRSDMVLQLLVEPAGEGSKPGSAHPLHTRAELLVDALRTDSVDTRARIHEALLYLGEKLGLDTMEVAQWKPIDGDSVTELETWIGKWRVVLSSAKAVP